MAGIFGAWNVDGRPLDALLAARMSGALAHRGSDARGAFLEGPFALGCRVVQHGGASRSDTQPAVSPSGSRIVFDGRLDNRTELIATLRQSAPVSASSADAELAASCYDAYGSDFARHLAGDFAIAVIDPAARTVVLARDAIGVRPLYFRRAGAAIRFASEIKALLVDRDCEARPHDRLLAELLLRRLHRRDHDGSTLFEGIHAVPPAHTAILTPSRTELRRYWDFDDTPPPSGRSFEECAEGLLYHLERSVARRLRHAGPQAIAVSGGLDSSAIFCVADRFARAKPTGFTYATRDRGPADESEYIAELERACGRPIVAVDPGGIRGVASSAAELIRRVEAPMANPQWHRADSLVAAVRASGSHTLMSGHWGDQLLFDQAYLVDLLRGGSWLTVRTHLRAYREWHPDAGGGEFTSRLGSDLLEYGLPPWVRSGVRAVRAIAAQPPAWEAWFSDRFREQAGPDVFGREGGSTALGRALYREVRSRYHELCLGWHNAMAAAHGVERTFPFLDRDLIQFVMGVPGRISARDGVPKALLRGALHGRVPQAILQRRTKGDFTAAVNSASRDDHAAIARMLTPDALVVQLGYVDADKLIAGLEAARSAMKASASCAASWRVNALLALELWLREFIEFDDRRGRVTDHAKATAFC